MTAPDVVSRCDVCGGHDTFVPWLETSVSGVLDRWIHRCRTCGFHQVRPRLTADEIAALYPPTYFGGGSVGYGDYGREAQRRQRESRFVARRARRGPGRRVLEVGCALGFLLAGLRDHGLEVTGVDASRFASYYAGSRYGIRVVPGTLEQAAFPDDAFDLVIQKDLLEHVGNPRAHLLETRRVLSPGGLLWLVTPNGAANLRPLARVAGVGSGDGLPLLDQGHLSFFSIDNLRRLVGECGFAVERARTIGVRRGLRALGWLPGQRRFARRSARSDGPDVPIEAGDPAAFEDVAREVDRSVARHHRPLRSWRPYAYLHRLGKRLDSLPAATTLGYDFELWLRAR